jgi:hypothetical protein
MMGEVSMLDANHDGSMMDDVVGMVGGSWAAAGHDVAAREDTRFGILGISCEFSRISEA